MALPLNLSVVIATYNRREVLERTLPTLFNQDLDPAECEVVIVVDGSTDGTLDMLRALKPKCTLQVLEQANRGQAAAQNRGWNAARSPVVLFLDDDDLCDPSLFREHVTAHGGEKHPVVVFGPCPLAPESPSTLAAEWTSATHLPYMSRMERNSGALWPDDATVVPNVSVPRSALAACGGFDESLGTACPSILSDVDLGLRLWKMGLPFRYRPSALTYQLYVKSSQDFARKDAFWYGKAQVLLCRKHPEYRPHSWLTQLGNGPRWKRLSRMAVMRLPVSVEPVFRGPVAGAERLPSIPAVRRLGVHLLQFQHTVVRLRSALQQAGSWEALRREFLARLPVLMYHHVGPPQPSTFPSLTISPEQFERQVRGLARQGYTGIRPSDWLAWRRDGMLLPAKPVLLTFDDAYADLTIHAFPILQKYGFGAAVFVVTSQIGGTNVWDEKLGSGTHRLLNAEQIRHWAAQGIEFGAHSRTHRDLTTLSAGEVAEEVSGSGQDLARLLEAPVISFAYPYGTNNELVRSSVRSLFDLAFGIDEGLNELSTDPHLLRRTMVLPGDTWLDFRYRASLGRNPLQRFRRNAGRAVRNMVGSQT